MEYDQEMETRVTRLEVNVEHIQRDLRDLKDEMRALRKEMSTDFRILFATIITVTLGLAALMAKGFHWL